MTDYEYDHAIMFRVYHAEPEPWLWDWWEGWLDGWEGWYDPNHPDPGPPELRTDEDGNEYYHTDLWFSWEHDEAAMFDAMIEPDDSNQEGTLEDACVWVRVGYHECTHPGAGGACSWDEIRESGPVPGFVATLTVD